MSFTRRTIRLLDFILEDTDNNKIIGITHLVVSSLSLNNSYNVDRRKKGLELRQPECNKRKEVHLHKMFRVK